jgi:hypothetical protein
MEKKVKVCISMVVFAVVIAIFNVNLITPKNVKIRPLSLDRMALSLGMGEVCRVVCIGYTNADGSSPDDKTCELAATDSLDMECIEGSPYECTHDRVVCGNDD